MTALELLAANPGGTKSLSALDGFCRAVWGDWERGGSPTSRRSLAETIEERRRNK